MSDDTRGVNPHPLSSRGLFVPLDVNYADDPKMIEAGAEAELVYVRSLAIAKRIGSDGAIHRAHLPRLCDGIFSVVMGEDTPDDLAARLVKVGAWIDVPDGWRIASWDKWNLTAEEIQTRRSGRQKGAAIGNHKRWHEARGEFDPTCVYCTESLSDRSSESLSIGTAKDSESTKTETEREGANDSLTPRGSRIPIPYEVLPEDQEWAEREHPLVDWDAETKKFVDHFRAKTGKDATKLDWPATWRNWIRRAAGGWR